MKAYKAIICLIVTIGLMVIASCGRPADPDNPRIRIITQTTMTQHGLEGCVFTRVDVDIETSYLRVIRCPNSSTSTTATVGKTVQTVTTTEPTIMNPTPIIDPAEQLRLVKEKRISELQAEIEQLKH